MFDGELVKSVENRLTIQMSFNQIEYSLIYD